MSITMLEGYILVPESDLSAVLAELPNHIALTRAEAGCLVFNVQQDAEQPTRFTVYEEYVDRASLEFHQQRVKASYWGAVSVNVERHYKIWSETDE